MPNLIIFDFEVFKYDCLLGAKIVSEDNVTLFQSWDPEEMKELYAQNTDSIWIGHNNSGYDNFILQTILRDGNPWKTSKAIIEERKKMYLDIDLIYYDLMCQHHCSLKLMEAYLGKNISETEVDFNLDRHLTNEEKLKTESYNRDDLDQTFDDLLFMQADFNLRLDVIKEFKLPISCVSATGTRIAEEVLHAKKTPGIETWRVLPKMYPQLQIKNQALIDFYMSEKFRTDEKLDIMLCGLQHRIGSGGIHAAEKKIHVDSALYLDVSGYYNLVMLLYNLLPRSIPDEYKKLYEFMYHEQLRLKKIDPGKRAVYKTILLSVFGAMMNEYCRFYDPQNGLLVTITGQLFLVDLLEKLEGKVRCIQSNTDGIIVKPLPGIDEQVVVDVVNEWQQRTGFVLKVEHIFDIYQRDVNCYMYRDDKGEIHTLGEAVKDYGKWQYPFWKDSYKSKEPMIISTAIVEYFMNHKLPEETIAENARTLRMFQYLAKKQSFDWLDYQVTDSNGNVTTTRVQSINRAFAWSDENQRGMLYKCRASGKVTKTKISNLPDSVFIYNHEILSDEVVDQLQERIDYQYYINRAYERILEFIKLDEVKEIAA